MSAEDGMYNKVLLRVCLIKAISLYEDLLCNCVKK